MVQLKSFYPSKNLKSPDKSPDNKSPETKPDIYDEAPKAPRKRSFEEEINQKDEIDSSTPPPPPVLNPPPPVQTVPPPQNIESKVPEKPLEQSLPETRPEVIAPSPVAPQVVDIPKPTPPIKPPVQQMTPVQPVIDPAPVKQPTPVQKPVQETPVEPPKAVDIVTSAPPYSGFRPDLASLQAKPGISLPSGQTLGQSGHIGQSSAGVHHSQNTFHPTTQPTHRLPTQPPQPTNQRPTNPPTQTPTHPTSTTSHSHSMSPQTQPQPPILPQSSSFSQGHHQGHPRLRAEIPKPINPNISQRMTSSQPSRLPATNQRLDQTTFNPKLNLGAPPMSIPNQVYSDPNPTRNYFYYLD